MGASPAEGGTGPPPVQGAEGTGADIPDGQVATATKGSETFRFLYDENGQRLVKLAGTAPKAAYLEEGYLDASGLTERFELGGRTVGVIKNGAFTTVATDLRGSVLAETTGALRVASPFGQRDVHPAMAAAIDYVEKGWDADLGLVRMGVRDYDPEINRFTTADPLFLEKPEQCVKSPVECNLYAYAAGDPVGRRDPTGTAADTVLDIAFLAYDFTSWMWHLGTHDEEALKVDQRAMAADLVCFLVPFATGGGAAVRAANAAERAGVKLLYAGERRTVQAAVKAEQAGARTGTHARYDGPKPTYHVNEAHVRGPKFNPKKEPLPADAEQVYRNAVPDAPEGAVNWYGKNSEGVIYRFSNAGNGTAHFSGSSASKDGIRNITTYAEGRLEGL